MFGIILGPPPAPVEEPKTDWMATLKSVGGELLATGTKVYTTSQQREIEAMRLKREELVAKRATAPTFSTSNLIGGAPSQGLPMIPIILGIGALGTIAFLVFRKR